MQTRDALIIVDVQNDFCSGGTLAVPGGDEVVPVLNRLIDRFTEAGLPIFATRDWHPEKTSHFQTYGGVWPAHCVQGTRGAEFHADLKITDNVVVVSKGMMRDEDSYSAFQAADVSGNRLAELLSRKDIRRIVVGGLATDYCVKHTVLDGLTKGFEAVLLADAIRAVNLNPNDGATAIDEMVRAGAVTIVDFENIPSR